MKLGTEKHKAALQTDNEWSAELCKAFGKRAGDVRYAPEGQGEPGTALRRAYEARRAAQEAWEDESNANVQRARDADPMEQDKNLRD